MSSEESLNVELHEGYPKRERWEGDADTLGYEIEGELNGGEQIAIHFRDEKDVRRAAKGEFGEIASHNSWLYMFDDGDFYCARPDGLMWVDLAGTGDPPDTEYLGVVEVVYA